MAKPKLALIPASQGPLVYSVLPSDGSGDFSFSRGSSATRINSQGLIETVASGDSRLEYPLIDGVVNGCPSVLLEPQRTNLLQYSEDFSNATWVVQENSTIVINTSEVLSPSGKNDAAKVFSDGAQGIYNNQAVINTESTRSVYIRSVSGVETLTIKEPYGGVSAKSIEVNESWQRYFLSGTTSHSTNSGIFLDDISASGIYIYGAQVEEGSYPTSYIPTNGTAVTRLADTANGAGDATTFNDSEGVLMVEALFDKEDSVSRYISISDSSSSDRVLIGVTGGTNILRAFVFSGGVQQAQIIEAIDLSQTIKVSISYKQNEIKFYKNGFLVGEDTSGITPVGLSELAFNAYPASALFYGKTKQIQYYNSALTDSELEELTSWESFTAMAYGQLYTIE